MSQSYELVTPAVTRTQIVRFAGAAGDFNPMHHDEPFARAAGQPSVFAMGQLTAAILGDAVASWFGAANVAGYGVRFKDKVWPGDALVLRADPDPEANERYALTVSREGDCVEVLTGWVKLNESAIRSS
ncbi:MAG: MaoC/PaaZ C-terminal domain-containing protein [Solirubrobacteraceae bacterium]